MWLPFDRQAHFRVCRDARVLQRGSYLNRIARIVHTVPERGCVFVNARGSLRLKGIPLHLQSSGLLAWHNSTLEEIIRARAVTTVDVNLLVQIAHCISLISSELLA